MITAVISSATASAKETYGIDSKTSITVDDGATLTADTASEGADIFCYGAFVNYGATVNAEIDALGGIHNRDR